MINNNQVGGNAPDSRDESCGNSAEGEMATKTVEWLGLRLPIGLTPDRADAAAQLISDHDWADYDRRPLSEVLSLGDLVIQLYLALCANPEKQPSSET